MTTLRKVWAWLKANVAAVVIALAAALGAGIFWAYHRGKVRSLKDQKAIEEAHRKVAALDAERIALEERREENAERIAALREERRAVQEELVGIENEVRDMDDDELERAFRDLY